MIITVCGKSFNCMCYFCFNNIYFHITKQNIMNRKSSILSSSQIDHKYQKKTRQQLVFQITKSVQDKRYCQNVFEAASLKYNISGYKLSGLTPKKVKDSFNTLCRKIYSQKQQELNHWYDNELRIFVWILIAYSNLIGLKVEKMKLHQWKILSYIFNNKHIQQIEFQAQLVSRQMPRSKKWPADEQKLLNSILAHFELNHKWKEIAQQLYYQSGKKYFRTPKQCREHWLNHLDPEKNKSAWSKEQDYLLMTKVVQNGKKWSQLAKHFDGKRTEHMVKNRFNSLKKAARKNITGIQTEKNQTQILSQIILSLRMECSGQRQEFQISKEIKDSNLLLMKQNQQIESIFETYPNSKNNSEIAEEASYHINELENQPMHFSLSLDSEFKFDIPEIEISNIFLDNCNCYPF